MVFRVFRLWISKKNETKITKTIRKSKDEDGNKQINGYVILKQIGKGSFGTVFLCMHSNTQKPYAMKVMEKEVLKKIKSGKFNGLELVQQEINIFGKLKHPNVVKLFEVMEDEKENKLYLIMEYMSLGVAYNEKKMKKLKKKLLKNTLLILYWD